ncbi:MAG: peptide chain release factor N(5)-glutamine methyltransferase [Pseudomonadota bacterium]
MAEVRATLREAALALTGIIDTPRLDVELLMAHALGVSRSEMLLKMQDATVPASFADHFRRRQRHEPIAYITGKAEFFGREFGVASGVLIPRPDSETLVEAALEASFLPKRVLDLGTGSGALLLTLLCERPRAQGVGVDASAFAVEIARRNAAELEKRGLLPVSTEWVVQQRDWHEPGWNQGLGRFDLVLCNPPYVEDGAELDPDVREFEPPSALFAGPDGLDEYRILIPQLRGLLAEGGVAILEIGASQGGQVTEIAVKAGFSAELRRDLAKRPRALILR